MDSPFGIWSVGFGVKDVEDLGSGLESGLNRE